MLKSKEMEDVLSVKTAKFFERVEELIMNEDPEDEGIIVTQKVLKSINKTGTRKEFFEYMLMAVQMALSEYMDVTVVPDEDLMSAAVRDAFYSCTIPSDYSVDNVILDEFSKALDALSSKSVKKLANLTVNYLFSHYNTFQLNRGYEFDVIDRYGGGKSKPKRRRKNAHRKM